MRNRSHRPCSKELLHYLQDATRDEHEDTVVDSEEVIWLS